MKRIRTGKRSAGLLAVLLTLTGCEYINDLPLLTRYVAKNVCTDVQVSGYDAAASIAYISNIAPPLRKSWNVQINAETGAVTARNRWLPGYGSQTALPVATDHEGCRNLFAGTTTVTTATAATSLPLPALALEWPDAVGQFPALQQFVQAQVNAGAPAYTTAILVVYDNQIVAEAYRDGIGPDSPLKGFSMSKSVANLLVGRLVDQGLLDVNAPLALPAWQQDARAAIRWDDSLRMSSGLVWNEASIGKNNQQGILFYGSADPAAYASASALAVVPGSAFNYSSADFMNVANALVTHYDHWFDPGWNLDGHFALEFAPDGRVPLLPEGVLLTTRGWAQLASLYMNDGRLGEHQILSPEWVKYSLTPTAGNGDYGAGIWLNQEQNLFPQLPSDAFAFLGSYDRFVTAIPSRQVIFVRIGFSDQPGDFDMQGFMLQALALLPAVE